MKLKQETGKLNRKMLDALMEKNVNRVITTKLKKLGHPNIKFALFPSGRCFFFFVVVVTFAANIKVTGHNLVRI